MPRRVQSEKEASMKTDPRISAPPQPSATPGSNHPNQEAADAYDAQDPSRRFTPDGTSRHRPPPQPRDFLELYEDMFKEYEDD